MRILVCGWPEGSATTTCGGRVSRDVCALRDALQEV